MRSCPRPMSWWITKYVSASTPESRWNEVSKFTASGAARLGVLIWKLVGVVLVVAVGCDYVVSTKAVRSWERRVA